MKPVATVGRPGGASWLLAVVSRVCCWSPQALTGVEGFFIGTAWTCVSGLLIGSAWFIGEMVECEVQESRHL